MLEILKEWDVQLFTAIHVTGSNTLFDWACPIIRQKTTWIPLYIFFAYLLFKKAAKTKAIYYIVSCVILIALSDFICAHILKEIFSRIRPCNSEALMNITHALIPCSSTYSFPSCHATNHFALAFYLGSTYLKPYRIWLLIWAGSIGFSQIYCGVHFPLDVIGGMMLGILLAYAMVIISRAKAVTRLLDISFD